MSDAEKIREARSRDQPSAATTGIYYNEFDPAAAAWLRELIAQGHLPNGVVDERSILDVRPADLAGYRQCHFFAGVGGWPYALRLAKWADDRPVWTGSPPCQPFSNAGQRRGQDDERHLAPHFARLVRACRPPLLFGEQVASAEVLGRSSRPAKRKDRGAVAAPEWCWIDDLFNEMEAAGYACGALDLPAAGVGAPHIRQRTFFGAVRLADAAKLGQQGPWVMGQPRDTAAPRDWEVSRADDVGGGGGLADADNQRPQGRGLRRHGADQRAPWAPGMASGLAELRREGRQQERQDSRGRGEGSGAQRLDKRSGDGRACYRPHPPDAFWRNADWLFCRDGRWRPVEPGSFPLADGIPAPMGRLRGYGNAIVPQVAAEFVSAFLEALAAPDFSGPAYKDPEW